MKRILIQIISSLIIISCSKDGDSPDTSELPVITPNPTASELVFPGKDAICTQGTIVSEDTMSITFQWNPGEHTALFELRIKNLQTGVITNYETEDSSLSVKVLRGTPYSWKIISKSKNDSKTVESPEWKFYSEGIGISNYAPFPADLISPQNEQNIEESITTVSLNWNATDIDDDPLIYDVYMGKTLPLQEKVATDIETSTLDVSIEEDTTYYWKIIAKDTEGNSSKSEIFRFSANKAKSSEKILLSFKVEFEGNTYEGIINEEEKKIEITLGNFDYKNLISVIEISPDATILPRNGSKLNFHDDLYFTVRAEDGSIAVYDLIVKSGQHEIASFEIENNGDRHIGLIDHQNSTITINLGNFDYSNLTPKIKTSKKAIISPNTNISQNFNNEIFYTVTSEIGTSKVYRVIAPIALTRVGVFYGNAGYAFEEGSINERFVSFAGASLFFRAVNIQNLADVSISLVQGTTTYSLDIVDTFYNHQVYNEVSSSLNTIETIIPYNVPSGKYTYRIYDNRNENFHDHKIEVINDDSIIKITGLNATDFTRDQTMLIYGQNLTSDFTVKSNANIYLFNDSWSEVQINNNNTELSLLFSSKVYSNLKSWTGNDQKPFAMYTFIQGYQYPVNSNTMYFNLN